MGNPLRTQEETKTESAQNSPERSLTAIAIKKRGKRLDQTWQKAASFKNSRRVSGLKALNKSLKHQDCCSPKKDDCKKVNSCVEQKPF